MTAYLILLVVSLTFAWLFCALFRRNFVKIAMETLGTKLVLEATDLQIVPQQPTSFRIATVDPKKCKDRAPQKGRKRSGVHP